MDSLDVRAEYAATQAVDGCLKVHSALGPKVLESAYIACLAHELRQRGLPVRTQVPLPLTYDGVQLEVGYRIDMLVDDALIVEVKVVQKVLPIHVAQLLAYLRLSGTRLGLLLNFHVPRMKEGIMRLVNDRAPPAGMHHQGPEGL